MIEFPCNCGHRFSVPDDQAGAVIQCPRCRKLNDIPLLGDLPNLDDDGVYKMDEVPNIQDPQRVSKLTEVYTREHFDDDGNAFDLRGSIGDPRRVGAPRHVPSNTPKYDPITGELLEEIDIKPDLTPPPATLPVARRAPIPPKTSIDGIDIPEPYEAFMIPVRLFKPANLLVMALIFFAHLMTQGMMVGISYMYFLLYPFWMLINFLFFAHYANVIDETGPSSKHELPTPARHLDWHDDTFGPAVRAITALAICYGPAILMLLSVSKKTAPIILTISAVLALVGTILVPAAALATTTSGSIYNARPDRLFAVAMICGAEYVLAVFTWIVAIPFLLAGSIGINLIAQQAGLNPAPLSPYVRWYSAYGCLIVGIYLMHFFCWHLGTLYRRHHASFPWVMQRFAGASKPTPTGAFPVQRPSKRPRTEPPKTAPMRVEPITPPKPRRSN